MNDPQADWDREGDLARIRDAYARYERDDRARLWDLNRAGYARAVHESQEAMVAAIRESIVGATPSVLDVGCGDGDMLDEVVRAAIATEWTGVDLRTSAIQRASERFPDATFAVASADELPFGDQKFDIAIAKVLFSSLPSWELEVAVSREIERILRPGGSLIWLDLRYPNPRNSSVHAMPRERIQRLFPDWDMYLRTIGLLPPIARRLGGLTSLLYAPLHAFPPLRSHLVGRLIRP